VQYTRKFCPLVISTAMILGIAGCGEKDQVPVKVQSAPKDLQMRSETGAKPAPPPPAPPPVLKR